MRKAMKSSAKCANSRSRFLINYLIDYNNGYGNKIEILAPAGSMDSVIAAVRSGADAVYLGEKEFSARSSAHNFDENELKEAVCYCHIHSVKVYVTLNTIVLTMKCKGLKRLC